MRALRLIISRLLIACVFLSISLFLTSCTTTSGKNFSRVSNEMLLLGKTTTAEVKNRLGAPTKLGTSIKNEFDIDTYTYIYTTTTSDNAIAGGLIPQRFQIFHFLDKKLVGYEFSSSFKEDNTDFNNIAIKKIQKGSSNRAEVISLLGEPSGKSIYPLIPNKDEEASIYTYNQARGNLFNLKFYQKRLLVTFNGDNTATNIDFLETGEK